MSFPPFEARGTDESAARSSSQGRFCGLERRVDGHRVAATQTKIVAEPLDDLAGFDAFLQFPLSSEALLVREILEVVDPLAVFARILSR